LSYSVSSAPMAGAFAARSAMQTVVDIMAMIALSGRA
jgi:hypothetical protein